MFTVKQTDHSGNVRLIECSHVAIKAEHGMSVIFMEASDGRKLAPITGWPSDDKNEDMLYVMNSNGATVAAQRFRPSAASTLKHGDHAPPHPTWVPIESMVDKCATDGAGNVSAESCLGSLAQAA